MPNFFALLVGIDNYPNPAHRLYGCLNDANSMEEYLRQRFAPDQDPSRIKVLRDDAAKRQDVIDAFERHLGQAQAGDTALFYYAGHGSQEQAPVEFWPVEPDHMNETMVCWDSRQPGGWDLADKEIAKLIEQVSSKGVHMAVILDCCHSGSGTRGIFEGAAERRIPPDDRPRPFSSYIPAAQQPANVQRSVAPAASGWDNAGSSRHVLLAACRDEQTAKEYSPKGQRHGALTYFLLDTLASAQSGLTYQEVFERLSALISANVAAQNPQLEATVSDDLSKLFLSGTHKARADYFTAGAAAGGWSIDGGAVHGVPAPSGDETVALALYALDADPAALRDISKAITTAKVTAVGSTSSRISVADEAKLDAGTVYKAVVTALPLPRMAVLLEGAAAEDAAPLDALRKVLASSLYVKEAPSEARFRVLARGGQFLITRPGGDRPLVAQIDSKSGNENAVKDSLEHIAKWTTLANLKNPLTRLPQDQIKLSIIANKDTGEELAGNELRMEYPRDPQTGKYVNPKFWVRVQNHSDQPLYCALVALSEMFGISAGLLAEGTKKLNPGEELWAFDGKPIYAKVAPPLQNLGITESRDVIELIACAGPFDARLMEQPEQDGPRLITRGAVAVSSSLAGTLSRLMSRLQTRSLASEPDDSSQALDDFVTYAVAITTVRPRDERPISSAAPADLGNGVVIAPHPALQAEARLTTVPQISRDLGNLVMPEIFRREAEQDSPYTMQFNRSRGTDPGLSVLELNPSGSQPINIDAVTPENPLRVHLEIPLEDNAEILPFAFDGEFYVPLGYAVSEAGKTVVELQRLPTPVAQKERSLTGSIRILFQKLIVGPLGFGYDYPILAVASLASNGKVSYEHDADIVKRQVAAAQRILVCVHGIIGDTRAIAAALLAAGSADLVLAFDYENINTTVEENAELLKERLAAVGLGPGHGKTVQIVAHSMGGLISRWFIEKLDGNLAVQSLAAAGTPQDGSPWPNVEGFIGATTSLALNNLTAVAWPATALGFFVRQARNLDKALPELRAGSDFLKLLAQCGDPKVSYTFLAGNTSMQKPPAPGPDDPWYLRMAESISISDLLHRVLSVAFFNEPNDIAVSVKSATSIGAQRQPAPVVHQTACDHLSYFSDRASTELLWKILGIAPHP